MLTCKNMNSSDFGSADTGSFHSLFHSACLYFQHFRSEFVTDIQTNLVLQCEAASQKRCRLGSEWSDIICLCHCSSNTRLSFLWRSVRRWDAETDHVSKEMWGMLSAPRPFSLPVYAGMLFLQLSLSPPPRLSFTAHPSRSRRERRERWALLQ